MTDYHLEEHAARAVRAGRLASRSTTVLVVLIFFLGLATLSVALYSEDRVAADQTKLTQLAKANQDLLNQRTADQAYANNLVIQLLRRQDASDQYIEKAITALYNALKSQGRLVLPPLPSPAPTLSPPSQGGSPSGGVSSPPP